MLWYGVVVSSCRPNIRNKHTPRNTQRSDIEWRSVCVVVLTTHVEHETDVCVYFRVGWLLVLQGTFSCALLGARWSTPGLPVARLLFDSECLRFGAFNVRVFYGRLSKARAHACFGVMSRTRCHFQILLETCVFCVTYMYYRRCWTVLVFDVTSMFSLNRIIDIIIRLIGHQC